MTKTEIFELITLTRFCIPIVITLGLLFLLPKSWPFKYKTLLSVIVAWIATVLFTIHIYVLKWDWSRVWTHPKCISITIRLARAF